MEGYDHISGFDDSVAANCASVKMENLAETRQVLQKCPRLTTQ